MDFILSFVAILILSPVLVIVSILVRIKLGSPIAFKQKRKIFTLDFLQMKELQYHKENQVRSLGRRV